MSRQPPPKSNLLKKGEPAYLASDIGGTRIKIGVVHGGRLLARVEIDARANEGFSKALDRIATAARKMCRSQKIEMNSLAGFGLSFPGIIEPRTEKILSAPAGKFDDAKNLDVSKIIHSLLGLPVRICNDANAALAGEWKFGAARGCRSMVMMTMGTGIGSAAVVDGIPLRGQHGQAGSLGGHFALNYSGRNCPCGNIGCAETEASTWALPAHARASPCFAASALARENILDYAAVFRLAARGDVLAAELLDRAICVWSAALVNLIHAYDPECAIVGGGIMRSSSAILPKLRRHVARHAWTPWGKVKIKPAVLGNDAGMLGVASLFAAPK